MALFSEYKRRRLYMNGAYMLDNRVRMILQSNRLHQATDQSSMIGCVIHTYRVVITEPRRCKWYVLIGWDL